MFVHKARSRFDFVYTGYRVPLIAVSPYTQKNYVSHTLADRTAILKLIETRFNLPPLTKRDAAQMDMTEFFNFNNPVWLTPPTPPAQNTSNPCYLNKLPQVALIAVVQIGMKHRKGLLEDESTLGS
jgi:phospholipase C